MIILVPTFQWTRTNLPLRPWISSTRSLFMITFRLDWLSRSSHHGLTVYPNSWVLFPLFRYECVSVPTRMRLSVPVMSVSIISGLLIISSTHIQNILKPSTSLYVYSSAKLRWIWVSSPVCMYFPPSYYLGSVQSRSMCLNFPQLYQSPLNPPGFTLFVRAVLLLDSYCCARGLLPPFQLTIVFSEAYNVLVQRSLPFTQLLCMYLFNSVCIILSGLCTSPTTRKFFCASSFDPRYFTSPIPYHDGSRGIIEAFK